MPITNLCVMTSGDDPYTSTGYGQIWQNLLSRWTKSKPKWKFYHIGWQNRDREHLTREGYHMLPIQKQEYGFDVVLPYLIKYKPDIFLTMTDIGLTAGFVDAVSEAKKRGWRGRWFAINLVDTEAWESLFWDKILDVPDKIICGAKNGELLYTKHNVGNLITIPMGVDTKVYYPLAKKEELKIRFNLKDKFVVGYVAKNQRRKMIPNLMRGFSAFSKGKEDVRLLLHTDRNNPKGWDIACLIEKFIHEQDEQLQDPKPKIIMTNPNMDVISRQKVQPESMNEIYNLMDVFCYATGGEGFGLPGLEAQSCGVPMMMTNYSSAIEIVSEDDLFIPILEDKYGRRVTEIGPNGVENAIPDDKAVAEILEKLYAEWKSGKIKERGDRARNFALGYDWDLIAKKWIKLFEDEA